MVMFLGDGANDIVKNPHEWNDRRGSAGDFTVNDFGMGSVVATDQVVGLRETLQETPTFHGKIWLVSGEDFPFFVKPLN